MGCPAAAWGSTWPELEHADHAADAHALHHQHLVDAERRRSAAPPAGCSKNRCAASTVVSTVCSIAGRRYGPIPSTTLTRPVAAVNVPSVTRSGRMRAPQGACSSTQSSTEIELRPFYSCSALPGMKLDRGRDRHRRHGHDGRRDGQRDPRPHGVQAAEGRLGEGQAGQDEHERHVVELAVDPEPAGDLGAVAVREQKRDPEQRGRRARRDDAVGGQLGRASLRSKTTGSGDGRDREQPHEPGRRALKRRRALGEVVHDRRRPHVPVPVPHRRVPHRAREKRRRRVDAVAERCVGARPRRALEADRAARREQEHAGCSAAAEAAIATSLTSTPRHSPSSSPRATQTTRAR